MEEPARCGFFYFFFTFGKSGSIIVLKKIVLKKTKWEGKP